MDSIDLTAAPTKERKVMKCRKCGDHMDVRFYSVGGEVYALYGSCRCTLPLNDKIDMAYPMDETKLTPQQKETADPSFPLSCTICHSRVLQFEKWIDFNGGFWGSMESKCAHTLDPNYSFAPQEEKPYSEALTPVSASGDMEHISEVEGLDNDLLGGV